MIDLRRNTPNSSWVWVLNALQNHLPHPKRVLLTGTMALPDLHAQELLSRPELHRFLAGEITALTGLLATHFDEHDRKDYAAVRMHYSTYVEVHDYSALCDWGIEDDDDDDTDSEPRARKKDSDTKSPEEQALSIIRHHDATLAAFAVRLAEREAFLKARVARLYPRTAPIRLQGLTRGRGYRDWNATLLVNDQEVKLAHDCRDDFDRLNLDRHVPAELVPDVKWRSDLCMRCVEIVPGSPLLDVRFLPRASLSGRPTWINLETWARATPRERREYCPELDSDEIDRGDNERGTEATT